MAMIPCKNCGAEISDKAMICPMCGVKINGKSTSSKGGKKIWIVLGCILGVIIAGFIVIRIIQAIKDSKFDPSEEYVLGCVETLKREKRKPSFGK